MFVRILGLVLVPVFFVLPQIAGAIPLKDTLEVSGWIPYWRAATGTADLLPHVENLTTVHPFTYSIRDDGELHAFVDMQSEPWNSLQAVAREKKIRYIPTIMWNDGEAIHRILSDTTARRALAERIANEVVRMNYDGIDIDFEAKLAETNPYFSLFLEGLYSRMGQKWVYCTIEPRTPLSSRYLSTPPPGAGVYANDYAAINRFCDRVVIMAYDQGSVDVRLNAMYEGPYTPIADIMWVEKVMALAAESISKNKLVLGIPTYGYEYAVTPLSIEGYRYHLLWAFNPRYAHDVAREWGIAPERSRGGELYLIYVPTTTPTVSQVPVSSQAAGPAAAATQPFNILWWGDSVSFAQKAGLAKNLGLRGISVFKFDGGADPKIWEVIRGS